MDQGTIKPIGVKIEHLGKYSGNYALLGSSSRFVTLGKTDASGLQPYYIPRPTPGSNQRLVVRYMGDGEIHLFRSEALIVEENTAITVDGVAAVLMPPSKDTRNKGRSRRSTDAPGAKLTLPANTGKNAMNVETEGVAFVEEGRLPEQEKDEAMGEVPPVGDEFELISRREQDPLAAEVAPSRVSMGEPLSPLRERFLDSVAVAENAAAQVAQNLEALVEQARRYPPARETDQKTLVDDVSRALLLGLEVSVDGIPVSGLALRSGRGPSWRPKAGGRLGFKQRVAKVDVPQIDT